MALPKSFKSKKFMNEIFVYLNIYQLVKQIFKPTWSREQSKSLT